MGLKNWLARGIPVAGSPFDGKVKNMSDMSEIGMRRSGYTTTDGSFTDKGHDRLTSTDHRNLDVYRKAFAKANKNKR